jgi:probable F420-dependent oxidoreductase
MSQQRPGRRMKIGVSPAIHGVAESAQMPRFRDLQAQAQVAEQIGLDSIWVADHVMWPFPNQEEKGCWEAFTVLSGLAALTSRIQLGPLVACTSFRNPALLAKMADSLDEISDGRFILGLGAGWSELEYRAFGYPFDHLASRFEEALQIMVPLLREGRVDFVGSHYQAREAVLRPRGPSRSGPPIWIGGSKPRLLELTARYADGWNRAWLPHAANIAEEYPRLLEACQKVGRDPATLEVSVGTGVDVLAPGQQPKPDTEWITGPPEQIAEELRAFAEAGVTHLIVSLEPEGVASIEQFAGVLEILDQT